MPRGSSLPRRLGDQKMPAKPLRRLACSFGQLNSFPGQPCAKARIPNGQGCGGYPLARFGAYCDGLARPRTRAEHVRANFVIVAARIRLLAALQTATHHVGGWSAVIDERVPDNHQAAERRQALAGRPPVGMVAIPPPLPGPDQDSPLGRSEQALWDRGCRFPDCRDHVFGKLPWIWHDDVVAGVIRTLAGIIARAQARGGVAPGDPRPSRLFPDGHHGDGHAVLRGLRRASSGV
jgi:hypothetical protein